MWDGKQAADVESQSSRPGIDVKGTSKRRVSKRRPERSWNAANIDAGAARLEPFGDDDFCSEAGGNA